MTLHKQVTVGDHEIDEKIARLIKVLWRKGYYTFMSCQGGPYQEGAEGPHLHDDGEDSKGFIVFRNFRYASLFHGRTVSLLVASHPTYRCRYETPQFRAAAGDDVFYRAQLELLPMDPLRPDDDIRGVVRFDHRVLQEITEAWEGDKW